VRAATDKPFGVGFISSAPGLSELTAVAIEERVPLIAHSFHDPTPFVGDAHAAGILLVAQVQTVATRV
jgi:NAD(P)H-dependent flavin oxidoreductase YrpB (nitropropane dioxygenase family)